MPSTISRQNLGLMLGLLGVVIFGGTVPATRLAVMELQPWFITFGRAAVAGIIAAVILLAFRRSLPGALWRWTVLSSLCLVIGFPGFLGLALQTVPAAHSGVVLGLLPITTAVFAAFFAGESPSPTFWLWSALGAAIVTIFAFRDGAPGLAFGDFWLVCATLSSSLGYVFSGKLSRQKPGWEVICWQLVIAAPIVSIGLFIFWDSNILTASASAKLSFAYVSLFSMLIGFFAWNAGLAIGGIARVSQMQLLQIFVTLAISAIILNEEVTIETVAFASAVVAVIWFARKSRIKTSP